MYLTGNVAKPSNHSNSLAIEKLCELLQVQNAPVVDLDVFRSNPL